MAKSSSPDNSDLSGSCLCGALHYRIDGEPVSVGHCHCTMCRRFHGTAFATYAQFASSQLDVERGADRLVRIQSSTEVSRQFCGGCGSPFSYETSHAPGMIWIAAGTLDGDPPIEPSYHIFVGSKARWYTINDELPQFEEFPPQHG